MRSGAPRLKTFFAGGDIAGHSPALRTCAWFHPRAGKREPTRTLGLPHGFFTPFLPLISHGFPAVAVVAKALQIALVNK